MRDYTQLNGLALAYVGDAIYEIYVRDHLIDQGETKPNKLHRAATNYVSANAQAFLIQQMLVHQVGHDPLLAIHHLVLDSRYALVFQGFVALELGQIIKYLFKGNVGRFELGELVDLISEVAKKDGMVYAFAVG